MSSYDDWKLRSPDDEMSPLDEAVAEIENQERIIVKLEALLEECADHLNDTGARPDLLAKINDALEQL